MGRMTSHLRFCSCRVFGTVTIAPRFRDLAARLIAGQTVEGGWGYTCPLASSEFCRIPMTSRNCSRESAT